MNAFLLVTLKSALCMGVLYALYALLLKGRASFRVNRLTLLFIMTASLTIPLVQQPFASGAGIFANIPVLSEKTVLKDAGKAVNEEYSTNDIFVGSQMAVENETDRVNTRPVKSEIPLYQAVYLAGMAVSLAGTLVSLLCVLRIIATARRDRFGRQKILVSRHRINSFTFGGWIVVSEDDFRQHAGEIVTHESIHRCKAHCVDVCLINILTVLHWFNPAVWMMRKELKAVHEYEADCHTLNRGIDIVKYQLLLIEKTAGASRFAIASSFAQSKIKKRIIMMNRKMNPKMRWRALLFIPATALLTQAFARPDNSGYSDSRNMNEPTLQMATESKLPVDEHFAVISNDTVPQTKKNRVDREELEKTGNTVIMYNNQEKKLKDALDELTVFANAHNIKLVFICCATNAHHPDKETLKTTLCLPDIDPKQPQMYYFIDGKWWWSWTKDIATIRSIETLEPDAAVKRFGKKAANGAIVMKTAGEGKKIIEFTPPPIKKSVL